MQALCDLYGRHGVDLGELRPATAGEKGVARKELMGEIVIAPPGAIADRWARRLPDPVVCLASGWMRVKQRARQGGVELPLVISDHADWDELLATLDEVQAPEVWVTHGREEALVHAATQKRHPGPGPGPGRLRGGGQLSRLAGLCKMPTCSWQTCLRGRAMSVAIRAAVPAGEPGLWPRIEAKLGTGPVRSDQDLARLVEARLPVQAATALLAHGLERQRALRSCPAAPHAGASAGPPRAADAPRNPTAWSASPG